MERRWGRCSVGVAVAVAAAVVALATPAGAVIQGETGLIAFQSTSAGTEDIWITDADGSAPRRSIASSDTARDGRPAWAPPATLFIFGDPDEAQPGDTVTMLGGPFTAGAALIYWPGLTVPTVPDTVQPGSVSAVVPDGAQPGSPCLAVMNTGAVAGWAGVATARHIVIQGVPDPADADRCTQPLAFQSDRAGSWDIWVYDPPSRDLWNATADAPTSHETAPAWSSRTETMTDEISARERPLLAFTSDRTGNRDIFVLDPAAPRGTPPINVTNTPGTNEANPDWSPDGLWLTFEREANGERQLWILQIDPVTNAPGATRRVTAELGGGREPSWFTWHDGFADDPPAEEIAFDGPAEGERADADVHHVEAPPAQLPFADPAAISEWTDLTTAADEVDPAWNPVGSSMAYAVRPASAADHDLRLLSHDGQTEQPLTSGPGDDRHPTWQARYLPASVDPRRPRGRATPRKAHSTAVTPTPTPTPSATATPRLSPTPSPSPSPTASPSPTSVPGGCTRTGKAGNDTLRGTPGDDVLCGGGGNDVLVGNGGNDVLVGGAGADELRGGAGDDILRGGAGRDSLSGGAGADTLAGGAGGDSLSGGAGADTMKGGDGGDELEGGGGHDRLDGEAGRDRLSARDRERDRVIGGRGSDSATVDRRRDSVSGVERVRRR